MILWALRRERERAEQPCPRIIGFQQNPHGASARAPFSRFPGTVLGPCWEYLGLSGQSMGCLGVIFDHFCNEFEPQLDYVLLDEKIVKGAFSTAYKNFIADHKTITVRIPYIGKEFSGDFKSKQYFDVDHHLKPEKKKKAARSTPNMSAKPNSKPSQNVELSSLDSPNWIKDEVIDQYLDLITKQYTDLEKVLN